MGSFHEAAPARYGNNFCPWSTSALWRSGFDGETSPQPRTGQWFFWLRHILERRSCGKSLGGVFGVWQRGVLAKASGRASRQPHRSRDRGIQKSAPYNKMGIFFKGANAAALMGSDMPPLRIQCIEY